MVAIFRDFGNPGGPRGYIVMVRSSSNGRRQRTTWSHLKQTEEDQTAVIKRGTRSWLTIAIRSWPNRPAIGADSAPNHGTFSAKYRATTSRNQRQGSSNSIRRQQLSFTTIVAHDRGLIVAPSLRDRGPIAPRSRPIHRQIGDDSPWD